MFIAWPGLLILSTPTVNCPSQEAEVTATPTRPVDNVVITTKGLQDRNIHIIDGTTVKNKGKLILTKLMQLISALSVHLTPVKT